MNIAVSSDAFEENIDAINELIVLLRNGFENPEGLRGAVRVMIPECPAQGFIASIGEDLQIHSSSLEREVDAIATIPISTIQYIVAECEQLDWRDPGVIGTIGIEGNLGLVNHLARSCIRPSHWTTARYRRAARHHAARNYRALTKVEYLHQPSQRQVLKAMEEARPVVITGLEPNPPCRDWTVDLLAERYADTIVRVRSATQRQTMAEFIGLLKAFEVAAGNPFSPDFVKPYTEGATLPEIMWPDFGPLFFDREDFIPPQLWLGSVPTHIPTTSLHRDPLTGFLFQVIGRKRLDLYSADQAELLYPMKAYNLFQPCWFKPEAPDYDLFPKARDARHLSVTLNPGDLLIQPWGWFHQVHALESPNMSVSYFWRY